MTIFSIFPSTSGPSQTPVQIEVGKHLDSAYFARMSDRNRRIEIGEVGHTMTERRCENCRYFTPAYTCIEKPTWGHCAWAGQSQAGKSGKKKVKGLFTWADDVCGHFELRKETCGATRPFS